MRRSGCSRPAAPPAVQGFARTWPRCSGTLPPPLPPASPAAHMVGAGGECSQKPKHAECKAVQVVWIGIRSIRTHVPGRGCRWRCQASSMYGRSVWPGSALGSSERTEIWQPESTALPRSSWQLLSSSELEGALEEVVQLVVGDTVHHTRATHGAARCADFELASEPATPTCRCSARACSYG